MLAIKYLQKNWKWLLPLVMLSTFFPITISTLACILLICFLVIKSSPIYKKTVTMVQKNAKVRTHLGTPVQAGLLVTGNINRGVSGTLVNLTIPVSGPSGKATVFAVARKENKHWQFTTLQVQCRHRDIHLDLLQSNQSG